MLDTIAPFLAFVFLVVGVALSYDGLSTSDLMQTAKMIGGASFISLGFVSLWFGVKKWWKSRALYKELRNE